jgi:hypothetical protein
MEFASQGGMGKVDAGMEPSPVSATALANAPKELLQGIGAGVMQVPATALRAGTAAGIVPTGPLSLSDLVTGSSPRGRLQGFLDRTATAPDSIAGTTGNALERMAEFALLPGSGLARNVAVGAGGALAHGGDIEDAGIEGLLAGGLPLLGGKLMGGAKKLFGKGSAAAASEAPVGAAAKPGLLSIADLKRLEGGAPGGPLMPRPGGAMTIQGQASPVGQAAIEGRVPKLLTSSAPAPGPLSVEDLLAAESSGIGGRMAPQVRKLGPGRVAANRAFANAAEAEKAPMPISFDDLMAAEALEGRAGSGIASALPKRATPNVRKQGPGRAAADKAGSAAKRKYNKKEDK